MESSQTLHDRYQILGPLGKGGQADTFLAMDLTTQRHVVVKSLAIYSAETWKTIELFEREARILQHLDHSAIPKYVDAFHLDEDNLTCVLVQEHVDGHSLQTLLDEDDGLGVFHEAEARDFLSQMLEILTYLHGLNPPVIHRDIKPANIIRTPQGRYVLVDFGAVQARLPQTMTGSTFVGTTGYMPPEQLMGRASPSVDLFALGATTIHLCTGMHPGNLPVRRMRMEFESLIDFHEPFEAVLAKLIEPKISNRYSSPTAVKNALLALDPPRALILATPMPPLTTTPKAKIMEENGALTIRFKPSAKMPQAVLMWIGIALFLPLIIAATSGVLSTAIATGLGAALFLAVLGFALNSYDHYSLTVYPERFVLRNKWIKKQLDYEGKTRHMKLDRIKVLTLSGINKQNRQAIVLRHGLEERIIGLGLVNEELDWLTARVQHFLAIQQQSQGADDV